MHKLILFLFIFVSLFAGAQNKKPKDQKVQDPVNPADQPKEWGGGADSSYYYDSIAAAKILEAKVPREFMVYTKKPKHKTERFKLCFNLVCPDTILNFCVNDSLCKDPEVTKILFETRRGDTNYVLVFVDAFTKAGEDHPQCGAGKETKLVFVRWNTKTNKAKWKQKTVSSCIRNIVNMNKAPIVDWDMTSPLVVNYYKGGTDFPVLTFDPEHPESGFHDTIEDEAK